MNNISTSNSTENTPSKNRPRSDTIDLNDQALQVDISDALSERERVKFTVHTRVSRNIYKNVSMINSRIPETYR